MKLSRKKEISDLDVRHFIYTTFAGTSRPPSTLETADHFKIFIAAVEGACRYLMNYFAEPPRGPPWVLKVLKERSQQS